MTGRHLSVSQIERYSFCGENWRLAYVENISEPSTPDSIRGSAVHTAVAAGMVRKRAGGRMGLEEIETIAHDSARARFKAGAVLLEPDDAEMGIAAVTDRVADASVDLTRLHHVRVAPGIQPVDIEQRITVTMGPGLPEMIAVLDITDTEKRIHDTKTKGRRPNVDEARTSIQLSQYHISYQALHGEPPSELVLDHLMYFKPSKSRPDGDVDYDRQVTTRTQEQLQAYLDRVHAVNKAMEAGIAIPAPTSSWKCSPRYCGYYGTICKFTRGMLKP